MPALQAAVEAATVKITDAERIAGLPAEQQEIEIEKITRRKEQTQRDETAPAPSSTESAVTQPVSSPVVLIEVVLKAALQFQESIKNPGWCSHSPHQGRLLWVFARSRRRWGKAAAQFALHRGCPRR